MIEYELLFVGKYLFGPRHGPIAIQGTTLRFNQHPSMLKSNYRREDTLEVETQSMTLPLFHPEISLRCAAAQVLTWTMKRLFVTTGAYEPQWGAGVAAMLDCDHHVIGRSLLTVMTLDSFITVEEELSRLLRETLERAGKAEKHVSDFARTSFPVVRL